MKFTLPLALVVGLALLAPVAHAAPRQYVVVITEGISPQLLELGQGYLRKADEDPELESAFTTLAGGGKTVAEGPETLDAMKGLLETAHTAGFKTGLITTGDISTEAPLFYDIPNGDLGAPTAHYDFLAGGGRAQLAAAGEAVEAADGTYLSTTADLSGEIKGRILAPQAEAELSYALDRNPEDEAGISELATLAMDTLGDKDTPFVLVIHDTLIQKALANRDTPALFEEFRELNSVLGEALSRRDENPDLSVSALTLGAASAPRFVAGADTEKTYGIVSALGRSFQGVGTFLQNAKTETINELTDPEAGEYRDWKLSAGDKARISSGKLSGETAVRAFYEPLLKLQYAPITAPSTAYTVGLDTPAGFVAALNTAWSTPAK